MLCHCIYESVTKYIHSVLFIKQLKLFTTWNVHSRCEPFRHVHHIVFQFQLVARLLMAYLAKRLKVLSLWQDAPTSLKNVHRIHKTCFATFFYNFGGEFAASSVGRGNLEKWSEPRRNFDTISYRKI